MVAYVGGTQQGVYKQTVKQSIKTYSSCTDNMYCTVYTELVEGTHSYLKDMESG